MQKRSVLTLFFLFILVFSGTLVQANFLFLEGEEDWLAGEMEGLVFSENYPGSLELKKEEDGYVEEGIYTSPVITTTYPFTSMVPSWNVKTPGDSYVIVEVDVLIAGEEWSGWQVLGIWGKNTESRSISLSSWNEGYAYRINIDIFEVLHDDKAQDYKIRAILIGDGENTPVLQGLGGTAYDRDELYPAREKPEGYLRELDVPQRSQMVEDPAIRGRICSPVDLAMVLEKLSTDMPSAEVAQYSHDDGARIYGNWSFNVAFAGSLGYRAYVDYYPSLNEIKEQIARGVPVITSIRFGSGELDNSPIDSTGGHLVLVVGFKEKDGELYAIVNDPAAPDNETVRRLYRADQFEEAWIGIVYIIEER